MQRSTCHTHELGIPSIMPTKETTFDLLLAMSEQARIARALVPGRLPSLGRRHGIHVVDSDRHSHVEGGSRRGDKAWRKWTEVSALFNGCA